MLLPFHDNQPTTRPPIVTIGIIAINALVFFYGLTLSEKDEAVFAARHGFVPARMQQLAGDQREVFVMLNEERRIGVNLPPNRAEVLLSLVTCMFLHGGIAHILGNMWFFWIFGNNIEDRLGHLLFLVFYLVGGVAATFCHALVEPGSQVPVIGASGAVAAVLGGYAVTYPLARVRCLIFFYFITVIELPAIAVLGLWFAGQLASVMAQLGEQSIGGGIAFFAHIGGFVFGVVVMAILTRIIPEITPVQDSFDDEGQYYEPGPADPYSPSGGGWGGMPGRGRLGIFKPLPAPDHKGIDWLPGAKGSAPPPEK